MTKKDYELIARVLRPRVEAELSADGGFRASATARIAEAFADELAADNPRFNRERFLKACGHG